MNALQYQQMKREKAQEIVVLLDLFEGKITLSELMVTDISLLSQLRDAKLEIRRQQEKELNKATAQANSSVGLQTPKKG